VSNPAVIAYRQPASPAPFAYERPTTLAGALAALARPGAAVLAGGTDIVVQRAKGVVAPQRLVDVKALDEIRGIVQDRQATTIGAATALARVAALPGPALAALADGARLVGGWQTRVRGTLGGNACRASPAGDTLCALLVLGAEFELTSAVAIRTVAADAFFTGPGSTVRRDDELLTRIVVPTRRGASAYARATYRRAMDLAVAGAAARIHVEDGRCTEAAIAIGACCPTPLLVPEAADALLGSALSDDAIAAACSAAVAAARPIDDVRGTARYRLRVLTTLVSGVIVRACERVASEETPA
jgi:carbon-monoxide dehydrogenase medium subunit